MNNVVRVTWQALAAVLGGTQSLHTNSYDEALALPSEAAAELALRTQQLIAYESGVSAVADPLGGSYLIEDLTTRIAETARNLIAEIDDLGGAVSAIEAGFYQKQIHESAFRDQQEVERSETVVVGVNRFTETLAEPVEIQQIDPALETEQVERLSRVRSERDATAVAMALGEVKKTAEGTENLLVPFRTALAANATIGEICDALREVFGTYRANEGF
jgi:methylmalonyl-CoA mutase N-terminal domain/subunit